jgi:hypothetical protein
VSEHGPLAPGISRPVDPGRLRALARAYREAEYRWELGGRWHALAIGAPPGGEFARAWPDARSLGLLSAWNPQSVERPEAANRQADGALQAALEAAGFAHRPAFSAARNRSWREPGWLVLDMPSLTLDALARRFGQLGALHWERSGPVRMRIYAADPGNAVGSSDCVDWLGAGSRPQA